MSQRELRAEPRISVSCEGTLSLGDESAPCLIQNMCSRGFLIKYTKALPVGQVLHLKCQLYPDRAVECKVEVRHVNRVSLGARVIEMSDEGLRLCRQYIEEHRGAPPS